MFEIVLVHGAMSVPEKATEFFFFFFLFGHDDRAHTHTASKRPLTLMPVINLYPTPLNLLLLVRTTVCNNNNTWCRETNWMANTAMRAYYFY